MNQPINNQKVGQKVQKCAFWAKSTKMCFLGKSRSDFDLPDSTDQKFRKLFTVYKREIAD